MPRPLTESERNTISCALIVAAESYERHILELEELAASANKEGKAVYRRLAQQFEYQAKEARTMEELIQDAQAVSV